jgi:hypothetical protein
MPSETCSMILFLFRIPSEKKACHYDAVHVPENSQDPFQLMTQLEMLDFGKLVWFQARNCAPVISRRPLINSGPARPCMCPGTSRVNWHGTKHHYWIQVPCGENCGSTLTCNAEVRLSKLFSDCPERRPASTILSADTVCLALKRLPAVHNLYRFKSI